MNIKSLCIETIILCIWLLFPGGINAQKSTNYNQLWSKVEQFRTDGKNASALETVQEIYLLSVKSGDEDQRIKAIIHRNIFSGYKENAFESSLAEMEREIEKAGGVSQSILHSALAEMYWWYYSANRWVILERSSAETTDGEDLSTWSANHLIEKVNFHYTASLSNSDILKKVPPAGYDLIWEKSEKGRGLRPTLYDLLAWRAIEFYSNSESGLNKPQHQFLIDGAKYFAPVEKFAALNIDHSDSSSFQLRTVRLYRDLLSFHLTTDWKDALVYNDLQRLKYVRSNDASPYSDSLYLEALLRLRTATSTEIVSDVMHAIAAYYNELGNRYVAGSEDEYRWYKKKSLEQCQHAIDAYPESYGSTLCHNLRMQLLSKSIAISTENVTLPNQKFLALIEHSNVSRLYYRILEKDRKIETTSDRSRNFNLRKLLTQPVLKSGKFTLLDEYDYQLHRTEKSFPALKEGYYTILLSLDSLFSEEENVIVKNDFWVSSLGYFQHSEKEGEVKIHVTDRKTGVFLKGVKADLYVQQYNYQNRGQDLIPAGTETSDENGQLILSSTAENLNYFVMLSHGTDSLLISNPIYVRKHFEPKIRPSIQSVIFTDRAIYRPGQMVYFKGIVMERTGTEIKLLTSKSLEVSLFDANNQESGKVALTTNEFGTYQGSFALPAGCLPGRFYISDGAKTLYFKVEEYKRPSFRIETDSIKENIALGDVVRVSGSAINYSGSPIQGANVTYRVVRNTSFPFYHDYYFRFPLPVSPASEISHGETITDENGKWNVAFKAIPDYTLKKSQSPVYSYTVELTVTDINGETQLSKSQLSIGYQSLKISMALNEEMEFDEVDTLMVTTTNLQGVFTPAVVDISVFNLIAPENLERKRLWSAPDYQDMNEKSFRTDHPMDPYLEENDVSNWKVGEKAMSKTINTANQRMLVLTNNAWNQGAYLVKMTSKDPNGNSVIWEKRIVLFSKTTKELPVSSWLWIKPLQTEQKVGKTARILVGSSGKDAWLFCSLRDKTGIVKESWMKMNGKMQHIDIPILEEYRGNLGVQFFLVHSGRSYFSENVITVPYDNKQLRVQLETNRSEFEPGEKVSWNLKLTGEQDKGKPVEVLASMYDVSLDVFAANQWSFSPYNTYRPVSRIFTGNNFEQGYGQNFPFFKDTYKQVSPRNFDRLNWFGYNLYSGGYERVIMYNEAMELAADDQGMPNIKTKGARSSEEGEAGVEEEEGENLGEEPAGFQLRRDFSETAFFYPELKPDANGVVRMDFTMPDALTRWKFQAVVHSRELEYAVLSEEVVTKKELMIMPNYPRFFTSGDTIILSAKVVNISSNEISGNARLETGSYPETGGEGLGLLSQMMIPFNVKAESSELVSWKVVCPNNPGLLELRISAESAKHKDGEQKIIPVLNNKVLITDTYPFSLRPGQKRNIEVKHMGDVNTKAFRYTLEYTENPVWYVVQALPYLADPGNESSDQLFSRFFANSVSFAIIKDNPQIERVFEAWKNEPDALTSKLERNQELKQVLLSETPWLMTARSESENMKELGNFFDANSLEQGLRTATAELLQLQTPNGGWSWYKGMPDNRYITQHIVRGFGKLHQMGIRDIRTDQNLWTALQRAVLYMDQRIEEDYERIMKYKDAGKGQYLSQLHIHYLYARSFYRDVPLAENHKEAFNYFLKQGREHWLTQNKYLQAMLAIVYYRDKDELMSDKIMSSLKENALHSDEFGMYWKKQSGYYWHESDLGKQAMLIEAFNEVLKDSAAVEEMKIWLIKQKQTQMWSTSKATTEACWALLTKGQSLVSSTGKISVKMGGKALDLSQEQKEAGSGYVKKSWSQKEIKSEMNPLEVENKGETLSWGAGYYQYFGSSDKADAQSAGLSISREFYRQELTGEGLKYVRIADNVDLGTGDVILVRLIIKSDRNLEFVHLKDKRASGLEPLDSRSGYQYKGGLGYYSSVKDASNNFYFGNLNKGTYVLEYELKASNRGDFSSGFSQIQCYYAPEFSARSNGVRIRVE